MTIKSCLFIEDGYRESEASGYELLSGLRSRGRRVLPKLATGDGAMGVLECAGVGFSDTRHQRCRVHKTANVLASLPKSIQPKGKSELRELWLAEDKESAKKVFGGMLARYGDKYPSAMKKRVKGRKELLTLYDFPVAHWASIRTMNLIKSAFVYSAASQKSG